MSEQARPGILRLVLVAGAITLAITGVRLWGELEGWDERWFARSAGGGAAIVGISWLVILFGFLFGRRLAQNGRRPASAGKALLLPLLGFGVPIATMMVCRQVLDLPFADCVLPFFASAWVGALLALLAWPTLFAVNLLYGILARAPVVAVTYWAVAQGWDTHYTKPAPDSPPMQGNELAFWLSAAQVGFWIPFTITIGGMFGALGAVLTRKPAA